MTTNCQLFAAAILELFPKKGILVSRMKEAIKTAVDSRYEVSNNFDISAIWEAIEAPYLLEMYFRQRDAALVEMTGRMVIVALEGGVNDVAIYLLKNLTASEIEQ